MCSLSLTHAPTSPTDPMPTPLHRMGTRCGAYGEKGIFISSRSRGNDCAFFRQAATLRFICKKKQGISSNDHRPLKRDATTPDLQHLHKKIKGVNKARNKALCSNSHIHSRTPLCFDVACVLYPVVSPSNGTTPTVLPPNDTIGREKHKGMKIIVLFFNIKQNFLPPVSALFKAKEKRCKNFQRKQNKMRGRRRRKMLHTRKEMTTRKEPEIFIVGKVAGDGGMGGRPTINHGPVGRCSSTACVNVKMMRSTKNIYDKLGKELAQGNKIIHYHHELNIGFQHDNINIGINDKLTETKEDYGVLISLLARTVYEELANFNLVDDPRLNRSSIVLGKELEGINIVIVGKIDNAIKMMVLDVLESGVALMHTPVLHLIGFLLAHEMTIHNARFPEHVSSLFRSGFHLNHYPQKGRRHEPKRLAKSVEVVGLECAVVGGCDNDEKLGTRHRHNRNLLKL
ncbi:hypothetical protein M5K25_001484 [Dendrobium thyrsiflorum]|uniref:Uncharacterized protein n=1 Tax=Dendrobium thyrsiflorum TaxID=117978 RepID=A0ABD0VZC5_DENTH